MGMNLKRVFIGGVIAGIILIVLNVGAQLALAHRVQEEMNAWLPGSADHLAMGGGEMLAGILMKLVLGVLLVGSYAAIRPRFGPGARSAVYAALFVWLLGAIFFSDFPMMGMMSIATYMILEAMQFVSVLLATLAGTRMYSE